jgi:SAM-dependent methyltransferase
MKRPIEFAFDPDITFPSYFIRKRLLKAIRSLAPQLTGILMDFGCGSKPYRSLFEVDDYIGLDFENAGHSHANENIDVYYDGKNIPFQDDYFDSIFSSEVFEHIFNLDEILPELRRVLKPGGLMLVTCPFVISEHEVPNDFARYSSFGITHLLNKNGFEIESLTKTGNAVETVFQLWIMYIHQHITPYVRKIPVVRSIFRFFTYTSLNILALLFSKILPKRNDLYLNNVILCRKTGSQS